MRKNFIFKMSVVFVMGIMALGQVSCSSKTETNVDKEGDRKSTRLNSSHLEQSRMPSSA